MNSNARFDTIVLGAGGAGLMCAAVAGQRGKRVLVIDHADAPGKKILISGGGRCNFTNIHTAADRYISKNPHFAKSALKRYTANDFIELVDRYGIAWHEKTLGQLFCDGSARQIVDLLLEECRAGGVELSLGRPVGAVDHADGVFRVQCGAQHLTAPAIVIATGGPAIPKLGATGFAYDLARRFRLKVVEPRPALVPFTLPAADSMFRGLSGVSAPVEVSCGAQSFREAALFTHKGLSGPAILQISSYWRHGQSIGIDFLPDADRDWLQQAKRHKPRSQVKGLLTQHLPSRLAEQLVLQLASDFPVQGDLANLPDRTIAAAEGKLAHWIFQPNGTEGFAKAEVTVGGIDTDGLSSKTMEANQMPGLFAIGEAVDVTGWLGGYNFQWAWASGVAAGRAV